MSLLKYYEEALNVVNDGGLASLTDVETNYYRAGNPNTTVTGTVTDAEGNPVSTNLTNTATNVSGVPADLVYYRSRVPRTYNPDRRPGSRGQLYFSDSAFLPRSAPAATSQAVRSAFDRQSEDAFNVNLANRLIQQEAEALPRDAYQQPTAQRLSFGAYTPRTTTPPSDVGTTNPAPTESDLIAFLAQRRKREAEEAAKRDKLDGDTILIPPDPILEDGTTTTTTTTNGQSQPVQATDWFDYHDKKAAGINVTEPATVTTGGPSGPVDLMRSGGIASLARRYAMGGMPQSQGYYLGGTTDGMADRIPARIDNTQEARLSDGEFVIPADVVSHLGNGNSSAGAKNLYNMMDRVRQARTGSTRQGRQIDPNKFIPSR